ncbi:hypothetical protein BHE74_00009555 [Ensete ventricosum]|nr:hypothetical protein BHE74_00009555 [Ensete ventricosum]
MFSTVWASEERKAVKADNSTIFGFFPPNPCRVEARSGGPPLNRIRRSTFSPVRFAEAAEGPLGLVGGSGDGCQKVVAVLVILIRRRHQDNSLASLAGACSAVGLLFLINPVDLIFCFIFRTFSSNFWLPHSRPSATIQAEEGEDGPRETEGGRRDFSTGKLD